MSRAFDQYNYTVDSGTMKAWAADRFMEYKAELKTNKRVLKQP